MTTLTHLSEPTASAEALRQEPGLKSLRRLPNCILVKSVKPHSVTPAVTL